MKDKKNFIILFVMFIAFNIFFCNIVYAEITASDTIEGYSCQSTYKSEKLTNLPMSSAHLNDGYATADFFYWKNEKKIYVGIGNITKNGKNYGICDEYITTTLGCANKPNISSAKVKFDEFKQGIPKKIYYYFFDPEMYVLYDGELEKIKSKCPNIWTNDSNLKCDLFEILEDDEFKNTNGYTKIEFTNNGASCDVNNPEDNIPKNDLVCYYDSNFKYIKPNPNDSTGNTPSELPAVKFTQKREGSNKGQITYEVTGKISKDHTACKDIYTDQYQNDLLSECPNKIYCNNEDKCSNPGWSISDCLDVPNMGDHEGGHGSSNSDININTSGKLIDEKTQEIIDWALNLIRIIGIILMIILGMLDFIKGAASGDDDAVKKAKTNFVKRLIACVILFLIPIIVDLIIWIVNSAVGSTVIATGNTEIPN